VARFNKGKMEFTSALDEATREIGICCLKPKQREAIESFASGRDLFVSLPTGYGKSIIYAILPLLFDKLRGTASYHQYHFVIFALFAATGTKGSIVVCISPLTSIMLDQQQKFSVKGITAEFVGEAQTDRAIVGRVLKGDLQLLYISPENLNNHQFRSMLPTTNYKERLLL